MPKTKKKLIDFYIILTGQRKSVSRLNSKIIVIRFNSKRSRSYIELAVLYRLQNNS